jgi:hypothetical protein
MAQIRAPSLTKRELNVSGHTRAPLIFFVLLSAPALQFPFASNVAMRWRAAATPAASARA